MIQHVTLVVAPSALGACVGFYRILGFRNVREPPSLTGRATWLERAGTQVHLLTEEAPAAPGPGHMAVVVDDFEAVLGALRDAGYAPGRRRRHWGSPRAMVRDPAGHLVEVMAFAPPPGHPTAGVPDPPPRGA